MNTKKPKGDSIKTILAALAALFFVALASNALAASCTGTTAHCAPYVSGSSCYIQCFGQRITQTATGTDSITGFTEYGKFAVWKYTSVISSTEYEYAYYSSYIRGENSRCVDGVCQITYLARISSGWNDVVDSFRTGTLGTSGDGRVTHRFADRHNLAGADPIYAYHEKCISGEASNLQITETAHEARGDSITSFSVSDDTNTASWHFYDGYQKQGWDNSKALHICQEKATCTGPCCEDGIIAPSTKMCQTQTEYSCPNGTGFESDVFKRTKTKYCSGNSEQCTGLEEYSDWELQEDCGECEYCSPGKSACQISTNEDNSVCVGHTIPSTMLINETRNVSVTIRNTGCKYWAQARGYKLGAVDNSDPFTSQTRHELSSTDTIKYNQTKTFTFTMTAPATSGQYYTDWRMILDPVSKWFGGICAQTVYVSPSGPPTASPSWNPNPASLFGGTATSMLSCTTSDDISVTKVELDCVKGTGVDKVCTNGNISSCSTVCTFSAAGNYTGTCTATDNDGTPTTGEAVLTVTNVSPPTAVASWNPNSVDLVGSSASSTLMCTATDADDDLPKCTIASKNTSAQSDSVSCASGVVTGCGATSDSFLRDLYPNSPTSCTALVGYGSGKLGTVYAFCCEDISVTQARDSATVLERGIYCSGADEIVTGCGIDVGMANLGKKYPYSETICLTGGNAVSGMTGYAMCTEDLFCRTLSASATGAGAQATTASCSADEVLVDCGVNNTGGGKRVEDVYPNPANKTCTAKLYSSDSGTVNAYARCCKRTTADSGRVESIELDCENDSTFDYSCSGYDISACQTDCTFTVGDSYTGKCVATDSTGLKGEDTADLTVNAPNNPPTASLSASPLIGNAPLTVTFTYNCSDSDGTITSCKLDYGDGSSEELALIPAPTISGTKTHTYTAGGTYNAVLNATDNSNATASDSETITVSVAGNVLPGASLSAVPTTGDAPLNVTFSYNCFDSDGTIVSCSLNFGDGSPAAEFASMPAPVVGGTIIHSYAAAGNYLARLTATDDKGATAAAQQAINATTLGNLPPEVECNGPFQGNANELLDGINGLATDSDGTISSLEWSVLEADCKIFPNPQRIQGLGTSYATNDIAILCTLPGAKHLNLIGKDNEDATAAKSCDAQINVLGNLPPVVKADDAAGYVGIPIYLLGVSFDPDGDIASTNWSLEDPAADSDCTLLPAGVTIGDKKFVSSFAKITCTEEKPWKREVRLTATDNGVPALSAYDIALVDVRCPPGYSWDGSTCVADEDKQLDLPPQVFFGGPFCGSTSAPIKLHGSATDDTAVAKFYWSTNDPDCRIDYSSQLDEGLGERAAKSSVNVWNPALSVSCKTEGKRIVTLTAYDSRNQAAQGQTLLQVAGAGANCPPVLDYGTFKGLVKTDIPLSGTAHDPDGTVAMLFWVNPYRFFDPVNPECKLSAESSSVPPPAQDASASAKIWCSTATQKIMILYAKDSSNNDVFGFAPVDVYCPGGMRWDPLAEACVKPLDVFEVVSINTFLDSLETNPSTVFEQGSNAWVRVYVKNVSRDIMDAFASVELKIIDAQGNEVTPGGPMSLLPQLLLPGETKPFPAASPEWVSLAGLGRGTYYVVATVQPYVSGETEENIIENNANMQLITIIEARQTQVPELPLFFAPILALIALAVLHFAGKRK